MTNPLECKNTDRELWRGPDEGNGDFYADSIHVTENGGIGINCGGYVIVKPLREWHKLAASLSDQSAGDGWKMVPVEPTEAMSEAGSQAVSDYGGDSVSKVWEYMLAASPATPIPVEGCAKAAFDRQEFERLQDHTILVANEWKDIDETAKQYWRDFVQPILKVLAASPSLANEKEGVSHIEALAESLAKAATPLPFEIEKWLITIKAHCTVIADPGPGDDIRELAFHIKVNVDQDLRLAIRTALSPAPASKGPMEADVEKVARVMFLVDHDGPWHMADYSEQEEFKRLARAALGAMQHE